MTAGLSLAVNDFASVSGLPAAPGSTGRRPLVFVTCADDHSVAATSAATKHLVADLGVPAIIGSGYSLFTNAIAAEIAASPGSNTLLLAPLSTGSGPSMGSMDTWRIALPDDSEAAALVSLANYVGSQLDGGTASVSIAYKGDEYGTNVANLVGKTLTPSPPMNSYGKSDDAMYVPGFAGVVASIVLAAPRIIVLVGTDEAVGSILQAIESSWTASTRPSYVLSSGMLTPGLWKALAAGDPTSVRTRILGVAGGATGATFSTYQMAVESAPGAFGITSGAPQAYDSVYMLAYSAVALGNMPINGQSLVMGFTQLSGPGGSPTPSVGKANIGSTFSLLAQGQPVALQGASGPLAIKGQGRSAEVAQIWCIPAPGGTPSEAILSGLSVAGGNVQGSLSSACN
jgi:hypothetical protein